MKKIKNKENKFLGIYLSIMKKNIRYINFFLFIFQLLEINNESKKNVVVQNRFWLLPK